MDPSNYSIPRGSLILVTGANGYIASHVVDILLQLGYRVRGTVRAAKPWLDRFFEHRYGGGEENEKGAFESVVVPALEKEEAWSRSDVMEGVRGVVHIASDLSMAAEPHAVISRVIKSTINALEAADKWTSVKRAVLTSSSAAAFISQADVKGVTIDENTWNDAAVEAAWSPSTPVDELAYHVYAASKTQGEREAWDWVKRRKPHFEFNVIVPNTNVSWMFSNICGTHPKRTGDTDLTRQYGRILCPEIAGSTMTWTSNLLKGDDTVVRKFPPQWFVNVEDCARLHVIALLDPDVRSERIFAFAGKFNWTDIIGILRKLRPDNKLLPEPPANEGRDLSDVVLAPRAEQLLKNFFARSSWVGLEQSLADGIEGRY
ncbi:MAG: hypothetical protein M1836_004121 [Candelina mexicana]|nr:MAG: hypothetical protein M1836_004121 [Candelina mexicana]